MPVANDKFALIGPMRIAFYAPMKPPDDPEPSGDRRVARAFMEALSRMGHDVFLASRFRSYEGSGDASKQTMLQREGQDAAKAWITAHQHKPPDVWFTYHLYHKAPDWLGPTIASKFGIPYIAAEASHAPKQKSGPWSIGYECAATAIRQADRIIVVNPNDMPCLQTLRGGDTGLHFIAPFIDIPASAKPTERTRHRFALAEQYDLDPNIAWLFTAAMMRDGAKTSSFRCLAEALRERPNDQFHLLISGDGPNRAEVEANFADDPRATFLGLCDARQLSAVSTAVDIFVWPAIREGFGMALLEAQAAGLPVVAGYTPGVGAIISDGKTGILTPQGDGRAFADAVHRLLHDMQTREIMAKAAYRKALQEHSIERAMTELTETFKDLEKSHAA
jgi:glycosyltransferase involved in cell wall biosynthesis